MRILYMANNWVGWQIAQMIRKSGVKVAGLVLHTPENQKHGLEIRQSLDLEDGCVFYADTLEDPKILDQIRALKPDMGVSVYFGTILRQPLLDIFPRGCINIHPALLPFNRGAHPNVWSIVEGTPAGVTIHYVDQGVDTGAIIAQKRVKVLPVDTGKTLYRRLERTCLDLFEQAWPQIVLDRVAPVMPFAGKGTYHRTTDLKSLDEIKPDRLYTARELVDILRARTFEPYSGSYMEVDGRKVFMRLELYYEDQQDHG